MRNKRIQNKNATSINKRRKISQPWQDTVRLEKRIYELTKAIDEQFRLVEELRRDIEAYNSYLTACENKGLGNMLFLYSNTRLSPSPPVSPEFPDFYARSPLPPLFPALDDLTVSPCPSPILIPALDLRKI